MKANRLFWKLLLALALIGSAVIVFNGLGYFYRLAEWGFNEHWHFMYVAGWGFPFLAHFEIIILALLLIAPFWIFGRTRAPELYRANRKLVNSLVAFGLLLLLLALILESWLAKTYP
ncbi:hypothetical protein [Massilia horti]|uniref:Uncharacterized protein n=1 Tax=Massilia horti TaxID=2562153 RepID=A0A4Y9SSC9_9BURK|nr:hypothetical protein [Massilia horti]TFW29610.1 hypothetical protein E4O92_18900 [Massilia horti]